MEVAKFNVSDAGFILFFYSPFTAMELILGESVKGCGNRGLLSNLAREGRQLVMITLH